MKTKDKIKLIEEIQRVTTYCDDCPIVLVIENDEPTNCDKQPCVCRKKRKQIIVEPKI